ncbi:hypothetical protein ACLOJK_006852 [Asimina triloba]
MHSDLEIGHRISNDPLRSARQQHPSPIGGETHLMSRSPAMVHRQTAVDLESSNFVVGSDHHHIRRSRRSKVGHTDPPGSKPRTSSTVHLEGHSEIQMG